MTDGLSLWKRVTRVLLRRPLTPPPGARGSTPRTRAATRLGLGEPGRTGISATIEIDPPDRDALTISYSPDPDGDPDAGEVVWTWVPYVERDGRGKDRPVLIIGRRSPEQVYAVRMTSRSRGRDRDFLAVGSGQWDAQGRESWVDIEQLYLVHRDGMRREARALDGAMFARVAAALRQRYGWTVED